MLELEKGEENPMQYQGDYFTAYHYLKLARDAKGVLVAEFHTNGGPFIMTAQSHTEFVDAFYRIAQDRANKIVILTGAGGEFITDVDWSSFGDVTDPGEWSQVHDEGVQVLENIANIRVPVIAAIEGRAYIHSDYALLANVIVAAEGATFQDVGHYAVGVAPGDGIFTTWSYRAGAGRAEAFLLDPLPLPTRRSIPRKPSYGWDSSVVSSSYIGLEGLCNERFSDMAAWRRAIELSLGDSDVEKLRLIARSRTEPVSRVGRARSR